jgi:hypothetical protein
MPRVLSTLFTSIPAALWLTLLILAKGNDYYWPVYIVTSGAFLAASLAIGFLGPTLFPQSFKRHPGLFIFGQGLLAWMAAFFVLGMLNLTPLCVGQDNGDGNNNLALCVVQTLLVGFFYSPLEAVMLLLSAVLGGLVLRKRSM